MNIKPVGCIDFLNTNGSIGERCYYYTEQDFIKTIKEENYYGVPMVVNVFRNDDGQTIPLDFVKSFDPLPQGFNIIDYEKGEDMNDFRRLEQLAKQYKALYPKGTRIELQMMGSDPRPIEPGTRGTVDHVDDLGTIHCTFDNGRRLGIIPEEDSFRKLSIDEVLDERSEIMQREFIDKVNKEVIPAIGWYGMKRAYETGDMTVPTDLLKMLHEQFVGVYGTDYLTSDDGLVTAPGVVKAADGNVYTALVDIDCASSGEHWGTTFFTPNGVLSDQSEDPDIRAIIKNFVPYEYWYTPTLEQDHHVNFDDCPEVVDKMLNTATSLDTDNEVRLE